MRAWVPYTVAAFVAVASCARAQKADAVQSTLLHKGQDAFVHAVPLQAGFVVTFTVPSSGVMKSLLRAQPQPPPAGQRLLGKKFPRQLPTHGDLIAGVAVDADRLYVLTATRVYQRAPTKVKVDANALAKVAERRGRAERLAPPGAAIPGSDDAAAPILIGHQFKLSAFSLKDGAPMLGDGYELPLINEDPKAKEPPDTKRVRETLGRGPIQLVAGGIKCRGTTILFTGNDVKSVESQGKQFTPQPGFFARDPDRPTF